MAESNHIASGSYLYHGTYRIEKVIGQGGFGITYLATDVNLARYVAIKEFFPKDFCDREETTSRVTIGTTNAKDFVERLKAKFLKEARNIARFDHPGIIKIHASFEENDTAYYVMDYIEGHSLSEIVKQSGPLNQEEAVEYIEKVGDALEYLHHHRLNHLDVKPANIMVRARDNQPILIDFGLSKQYDSEGHQTSTTPVGISHGFAPMEQYSAGGVEDFSPKTDIYSLAATLFYILTGNIPTQATLMHDDGLIFTEDFPHNLIAPITKAMALGRKHRHETVQAFLNELRGANNDVTVVSAPSFKEETVIKTESSQKNEPKEKKEEVPFKKKKFWWGLLIALILVIVVLIICLIKISDSGNTRSPKEPIPLEKAKNGLIGRTYKFVSSFPQDNIEVISYFIFDSPDRVIWAIQDYEGGLYPIAYGYLNDDLTTLTFPGNESNSSWSHFAQNKGDIIFDIDQIGDGYQLKIVTFNDDWGRNFFFNMNESVILEKSVTNFKPDSALVGTYWAGVTMRDSIVVDSMGMDFNSDSRVTLYPGGSEQRYIYLDNGRIGILGGDNILNEVAIGSVSYGRMKIHRGGVFPDSNFSAVLYKY